MNKSHSVSHQTQGQLNGSCLPLTSFWRGISEGANEIKVSSVKRSSFRLRVCLNLAHLKSKQN
jgi:hypothetical protein